MSWPFDDETPAALRHQILTYHLAEVLTDSERARLLGLPPGCKMRERAKILAPEKLVCGQFVWIGEGAILDAQGGLSIGDYTQVGFNVCIWSHESHRQALGSHTCRSREGIAYRSTRIGANCYIAGPSVIGPGVTIGDRVVISPLSFVHRDLPDDTVFSPHREQFRLGRRVEQLEAGFAELLRALAVGGDPTAVAGQLAQRLVDQQATEGPTPPRTP